MQRLDALKNLNSKFEQNLFEGNEDIAVFKSISKVEAQIYKELSAFIKQPAKSIESCPFSSKKPFANILIFVKRY